MLVARVRKLLVFSAVAVAALPLQALPASAAAPPEPQVVSVDGAATGATIELPGRVDMAGVSFTGAAGADVELRASDDGTAWTPWTHVGDGTAEGPDRQSDEFAASSPRTTQPVWTGSARYVQVRAPGDDVRDVEVHGVDVKGHGESTLSKLVRGLKGVFRTTPPPAAAMTDQPAIVTRAQWGADESIRRDDPSYGKVRFAVLHHTVNANDYSAAEAPALIRGIYTYHVKTNGWDDIGYNFLVDRFGTIYEGRYGGIDKPVIGAHAEGFNTYSTGVSMLGTFTSVSPPAVMVDAVESLMAWRLDVAHVDPLGRATVVSKGSGKYPSGTSVTLDGIIGHRDVGSTSCPGDLGYAKLAGIRSAVGAMGLPKLYDPAVSPSTIEGRQKSGYESTTVTARGSEPLTWQVVVDSDLLGVVRTWTSPTATPSLSFDWDGTNDAGLPVPMGTYRVTVKGTSADGGVARDAVLSVKVVDLDLLKPVSRLSGADRYATAAAATAETAPSGASNVVIASGDSRHLVDSLVAGPLTAAKSAPLLLVGSTGGLPSSTASALDRLKPSTAWIVGGTAAVSSDAEAALVKRGMTVHRLAGADAPSTAAVVAGELPTTSGAAVVSRDGSHLVDGLAAAGPAASLRRPILLTNVSVVPDVTASALSGRSGSVWVVGGASAVANAVVSQLGATRIAGADRWATAAAVADAGKAAGVPTDFAVVASGENANLVDALAGGSFDRAVLLSARTSLPSATNAWLTGNRSTLKKAYVLGGTAAVGDAPLDAVRSAINQT
ncbi:MAG TPA: cell wall-binding repeat-containing protein [Acidimicrobiales bacterium]|nr:cell wall-binding repeat-containing protein [Acidimicrobiales bacterium]